MIFIVNTPKTLTVQRMTSQKFQKPDTYKGRSTQKDYVASMLRSTKAAVSILYSEAPPTTTLAMTGELKHGYCHNCDSADRKICVWDILLH